MLRSEAVRSRQRARARSCPATSHCVPATSRAEAGRLPSTTKQQHPKLRRYVGHASRNARLCHRVPTTSRPPAPAPAHASARDSAARLFTSLCVVHEVPEARTQAAAHYGCQVSSPRTPPRGPPRAHRRVHPARQDAAKRLHVSARYLARARRQTRSTDFRAKSRWSSRLPAAQQPACQPAGGATPAASRQIHTMDSTLGVK